MSVLEEFNGDVVYGGPNDKLERGDIPFPQKDDPVNHPSHYTTGKIEVIDFITDKKLSFCRGNAVKYIVRAGLKDPKKTVEDLEKAEFYIKREIEETKKALAESDVSV